MKTINRSLIAALFVIAFTSFAHAQSANTDPYAAFYPVIGSASTTANYNFTSSANAYLYIDLPIHVSQEYLTISTGLDSSSPSHTFDLFVGSPTSQTWIPLASYLTAQGIWDITGQSYVLNNVGTLESFGGVTQLAYGEGYHVHSAPEPMGTVLFLLGGTLMAVYLLRRKKTLTV